MDKSEHKFITWEESARSIVIDFEGPGRSPTDPCPHPVLLGALVPSLDGKNSRYYAWLLSDELLPMEKTRQLPGVRRVTTLEDALGEVLGLARERDGRLVAFSIHEATVVRAHCDAPLIARFEDRFLNVKTLAKIAARELGLEPGATLEEMLRAFKPNLEPLPQVEGGPAAACRALRKAGSASQRWKRWSPKAKTLARQLLEYNRGDCRAARMLLRSAAWQLDGHS